MNPVIRTLFRIARRVYFKKRHLSHIPSSGVAWNADESPRLLNEAIASGKPCMIARFGFVELECIAWYLAHRDGFKPWEYIRGRADFPNWSHDSIRYLGLNAGFFPQNLALAERFCELMLESAKDLDILASWLMYEKLIFPHDEMPRVNIHNIEPFDDSANPWTQHLEGKKVLVVHPFAKTILSQYTHKRELLFQDSRVLPAFELKTVQAVQSMGGVAPEGMETWFDALDSMKEEINSHDYDVCLIGCGAYGFPLAAHVKRQGKQAIHMGGALQLLFGIKGNRWTQQHAGNPYLKLFNEHWVFPENELKPAIADKVEDACYW